jgi:hypothetical protein
MITLQFKTETYSLKNELNELTIGDFEKISSILNDTDKNYIDKWSEVFIYLGVPEYVIDNFEAETFIQIVKQFNLMDTKMSNKKIEKLINVDGIDYIAFDGDEFKMTVKQLVLIEDFIKKNPNRYLGEVLAVIYKGVNIDDNMHFDKAHIKHKAETFRKFVNANVAIPVLGFLSKKIINDTTLFEDELTNETTN